MVRHRSFWSHPFTSLLLLKVNAKGTSPEVRTGALRFWWKAQSSAGSIWPVVQRELLESSRRWPTYWLRVAGGAAAMLVLNAIVSGSRIPSARMGMQLFCSLHILLLVLIVCLVPAMAADCVAREKREGTLGLLFLTCLSPSGIIIGKTVVQALRALALWISVLPVLAIPFLLGGVTLRDALTAASLEASAVLICLAAGVIASSIPKNRNSAYALAASIAAGFIVLFGVALSLTWLLHVFVFTPKNGWDYVYSNFPRYFTVNLTGIWSSGMQTDYAGWSSTVFNTAVGKKIWPGMILEPVLMALLVLTLAVAFAGRCIDRSWRDKPPTSKQEKWTLKFCTPIFRRRYKNSMRYTLDWNPIAWLQQYSWKARLSKWGLSLFFGLVATPFISSASTSFHGIDDLTSTLLFILGAAATFVGVSSFLAEKQSGALELILITPLSVNAIIIGRVFGLWKQFLPAALVFLLIHRGLLWARGTPHSEYGTDFSFLFCFCSLPFFVTYASLRVKNLIGASVLSWIGVMLSFAFGWSLDMSAMYLLHLRSPTTFITAITAGCCHLGFVALTFFLLRHSLSRRIYSI